MTRLSRRPPSVQYPLGRSRVLGVLLAAWVLAGGAVLVAWIALGSRAAHLSIAVALCFWLPAMAAAMHFWWSQARGVLQFDGQAWTLNRVAPPTSVPLTLSAPRRCFWICRRICGCASCSSDIRRCGCGWSVPVSQSAGWTCAVRYIRAPDRALTTLTKPPGKLPQGVNTEYP